MVDTFEYLWNVSAEYRPTYVLASTGYRYNSSVTILAAMKNRKFSHSMNTRHAATRDRTSVKPKRFVISWLKKVSRLLTREINLRIAPSWLHIHSHGSNESPPPPSMLTSSWSSERRLNKDDSFLQIRCVFFATKCDFCSARLLKKASTTEQQNTSVFTKLLARSTRKY